MRFLSIAAACSSVVLGCASVDGLTGGADDTSSGDSSTVDAGAQDEPTVEADAGTADTGAADSTAPPDATRPPMDAADDGDATLDSGDASDAFVDDVVPPPDAPAPPIAFVQVNAAGTCGGPKTSTFVRYEQAQGQGDLNVIVVGWYDSNGQSLTVKDSSNNAYQLAIAPTVDAVNGMTQAIYYAPNIAAAAAGANGVTVTWSSPASCPDVRIAEYSGLTGASVDAKSGAIGTSATANSGAANTQYALELVVGAGLSYDMYTGPGPGFVMRMITSNANSIEDRVVDVTGAYSATALTSAPAPWLMQVVTFH